MIVFPSINVVMACMLILVIRSESDIPDVKFEVLRNGGFRAYTQASENEKYFGIIININTPLESQRTVNFKCLTNVRHNGYFIIDFKETLHKDDVLYFIAKFHQNVILKYPEMISFWKVEELLDSYSIIFDGPTSNCWETLLQDDFRKNVINTDNWIVEHKIPTYTGPRYVFNSYLNSPETVFIRNDTLYLQPIAVTNEDDVRGSLNLGSSCTSSIPEECDYTQRSTFLLPPVKSALLRSRRKFRFGKFEITAKLPVGDWIFPIIQLARPTTDHVSVDELWIAFSRGNKVLLGTNIDGDLKTQVLFAGPVDNADEPLRSKKLVSYNSTSSFSNSFHTFQLNWYPDKLQFFIDGALFGELNSQLGSFGTSADNLEYELQIGVGVGGLLDFPNGYNNKPWSNNERNYMRKFFTDRINWLKTWNGDDTALKVRNVKVTPLQNDLLL